jgi:DnaK suppressor protein
MSVDLEVSNHDRFSARQTTRLKKAREISADTGDPGEAHNQAALPAATRHSVEQITGALWRIGEGAYGRCAKCGLPIPVERLEVLPTHSSARRADRSTTGED